MRGCTPPEAAALLFAGAEASRHDVLSLCTPAALLLAGAEVAPGHVEATPCIESGQRVAKDGGGTGACCSSGFLPACAKTWTVSATAKAKLPTGQSKGRPLSTRSPTA
mmetsp:Transcript_9709/g.26349  ORF Transcript_9709/g.26349 Transcript_9709/m.26349 type:complete len:108 (-) Transcript_9709:143-466(-)